MSMLDVFKSKYLSRYCKSGNICKICSSKFCHKSICWKNYKENSKDWCTLNSEASEVISSVSKCNLNTNCSKNVYLQSWTVLVKSEKKFCLPRLMFDCGSLHSFISEKLVMKKKIIKKLKEITTFNKILQLKIECTW